MTALSPAHSHPARADEPGSSAPAGTPKPAADARDAAALLSQILPAARLVLWEAWDPPLELIALDFGRGNRPAFQLESSQTEATSSWEESVHPADRDKLRSFLDSADAARTSKSVDYRLIIAEGELLWVRHWLLSRSAPHEGRRRLQGMLMPIPEQKHLEWECLRVSERECNRIGQELHDDLCQVLAGLGFMMHVIGQRAAKTAPDLAGEINELNAQILGVTDRVRSMAHGLFPARLNYATLRDALNDFATQTRTRYSIQVALDLPRKLPPHSPEQIVHVYRIAQEAVGNSVRHGGATAVRIAIATQGRRLEFAIEDNGRGFPTAAHRPEGIGMHVMQYRARVLGGAVGFKNLTPHGAAVQLTYPASTRATPRSQNQPPQ